ncbi:MAG: RdgB/HAM1 family non-canonical purine NTP pyrophosphatase [Planctomycetota bacterium]
MHLLIATTNPHKLEEITAVFAPAGIEAVGLSLIERQLPEPEEDQDTFLGNAELKALYYARETRRICLADDSGLVVDALAGRPGVRSARYAGSTGTRDERDAANNAKLLAELADVPDARRTARFVCAMCVATPDSEIIGTAEGHFEGRIAHEPRGENGFGYDPLLIVADEPPRDPPRTAAELSPDEKNARSHRGNACRAILPTLTDAFAND